MNICVYEYIHTLLIGLQIHVKQSKLFWNYQTQTVTYVQQLFNFKIESQGFWDPNADMPIRDKVQGSLSYVQVSQVWEHFRHGGVELISSYLGWLAFMQHAVMHLSGLCIWPCLAAKMMILTCCSAWATLWLAIVFHGTEVKKKSVSFIMVSDESCYCSDWNRYKHRHLLLKEVYMCMGSVFSEVWQVSLSLLLVVHYHSSNHTCSLSCFLQYALRLKSAAGTVTSLSACLQKCF